MLNLTKCYSSDTNVVSLPCLYILITLSSISVSLCEKHVTAAIKTVDKNSSSFRIRNSGPYIGHIDFRVNAQKKLPMHL